MDKSHLINMLIFFKYQPHRWPSG